MLQCDWKILTGILAARLRKTEAHTLSDHQYAAGPKRITHAICQARDAIQSVSSNQKGCAIGEMDFKSAYDKIALSWTWKVLLKKKCSPVFVETMRQLYDTSYVICVINNEQQPRILNRRQNIKQGDRGSTVLYNFSADALLVHLHKRLQGISYHRLPTAGPHHPKSGRPTPVDVRLRVLGFVDDVKCALTSVSEFGLLDAGVKLFEDASGSELHRDPTTKKCQLLTLGRWSKWKQEQSPLEYLAVVEELNFLGVKLARSTSKSRALNGEELVSRVKTKIGSYKAGRHSPLICRPYTLNSYVMSKVVYRSGVLNLRAQDTNAIQSAAKQWLSQNLLLKPPEVLVIREEEEGGLGLVHAASRCTANLIRTFVQQGHPESIYPNLYLNSLFRCYVLGELDVDKVKRPPYYSPDFFNIIKEAEEEGESTLDITAKGWQRRVMVRGVTHHRDNETGLPVLIQTNQEVKLGQADWVNIWSLRRKGGLTPAQKSWLFMWTEGLHVNNERLFRIGKANAPTCDFCDQNDNRTHILNCKFNERVCHGLRQVLETSAGGPVSDEALAVCDLNIPSSLQLPALFMMCEVTKKLQASREDKKPIHLGVLAASLKATAGAFLLTRKFGFAHSMICLWSDSFFADTRVPSATRQGTAEAPAQPDNSGSSSAHRAPAHPDGSTLPVVQRGVGV